MLSRDEWLRFLEVETQGLDYTNFKSRVQRLSGSHRHDVYMRVWSAMRGLRDPGADRDAPTRDEPTAAGYPPGSLGHPHRT